MSEGFELRCRECGGRWGNQPQAFCEECFSPLEVTYDYDSMNGPAMRWSIESRPRDLWRYAELLPLPEGCRPSLPVGFTPLLPAVRLAARWGVPPGVGELFIKNDAVCFPSLSFKDRVVAVALLAARRFGFATVSCSSTGNLANALAAQAVRQGFETCVFVPADLEQAKILNSAVYGARIVRIDGNYDQVNRLCCQVAEKLDWGMVNVNLRPYYAEGSKTVGFEIAEQLGWRLPDNVVVPMAGGSLITKIKKAFDELILLQMVEPRPVKFFGAQASGCSPISDAVKRKLERFEPQRPATIARSLAIGNPTDGPFALKTIRESGGWAEDATDAEILAGIRTLAQTEAVFAETAGGVTTSVAEKLFRQGRIRPEETTVLCVTGNGLKTTEAVVQDLVIEAPISPRFAELEAYLHGMAAAAGGRS